MNCLPILPNTKSFIFIDKIDYIKASVLLDIEIHYQLDCVGLDDD